MENKPTRAQALESFFERGRPQSFRRGEVLVNPYDYSSSAYYIESGYVKVYSQARNGIQNLLCILSRGDLLPLPGAFGLYKVESFYVAMSQVVVRRLPSNLLLRATERDTELMRALMWQMYETLMNYSNRVNTLDLRGLDERVASFLVLLAERFGVQHGDATLLDIPITHQEISDAVATTRESVSRTLSAMAKQGIIEQRNRLIVITDIKRLHAILD